MLPSLIHRGRVDTDPSGGAGVGFEMGISMKFTTPRLRDKPLPGKHLEAGAARDAPSFSV